MYSKAYELDNKCDKLSSLHKVNNLYERDSVLTGESDYDSDECFIDAEDCICENQWYTLPVPADGDCFYHAILAAMSPEEKSHFLHACLNGREGDDDVLAIREALANYVLENINSDLDILGSITNIDRLITGLLTKGDWDGEHGDIAPVLITRLPGWPSRPLEIYSDTDGHLNSPVVFDRQRGEENIPLRIILKSSHYSPLFFHRERNFSDKENNYHRQEDIAPPYSLSRVSKAIYKELKVTTQEIIGMKLQSALLDNVLHTDSMKLIALVLSTASNLRNKKVILSLMDVMKLVSVTGILQTALIERLASAVITTIGTNWLYYLTKDVLDEFMVYCNIPAPEALIVLMLLSCLLHNIETDTDDSREARLISWLFSYIKKFIYFKQELASCLTWFTPYYYSYFKNKKGVLSIDSQENKRNTTESKQLSKTDGVLDKLVNLATLIGIGGVAGAKGIYLYYLIPFFGFATSKPRAGYHEESSCYNKMNDISHTDKSYYLDGAIKYYSNEFGTPGLFSSYNESLPAVKIAKCIHIVSNLLNQDILSHSPEITDEARDLLVDLGREFAQYEAGGISHPEIDSLFWSYILAVNNYDEISLIDILNLEVQDAPENIIQRHYYCSPLLEHLEAANERVFCFLKKNKKIKPSRVYSKMSKEQLVARVSRFIMSKKTREKKKIKLAKIILRYLNIGYVIPNSRSYDKLHESIINTWLSLNILGNTLENHILNSMYQYHDADNNTFYIHGFSGMFNMENLKERGLFNISKSPSHLQDDVNGIWRNLLRNEIPVYEYNLKETGSIELNDVRFLWLYSGMLFLADMNITSDNLDDVYKTGESLWNIAEREGVSIYMLRYLSTPSLMMSSMFGYENIHEDTCILNITERISAVQNTININRKQTEVKEKQKKITKNYKAAVNGWVPRGDLARNITKNCILESYDQKEMNEFEELSKAASLHNITWLPRGTIVNAEVYMDTGYLACSSVPDLTALYLSKTKQVSKAFAEVDRLFIEYAINDLPDEEQHFLNDRNTIINELTISMKGKSWCSNYYTAVYCSFPEIKVKDNIGVFLARKGNETRYYLLKPGEEEGYVIKKICVTVTCLWIYGVFELKPVHNMKLTPFHMNLDGMVYELKIIVAPSDIISDRDIVKHFSEKHKEKFQSDLYDAGWQPTSLEKTVNVIKHLIPFYDCITAGIKRDHGEILTSCLADLLSIIPIIGEVTVLTHRFASSSFKGVVFFVKVNKVAGTRHGLKAAASLISLPSINEMSSLGKQAILLFDPGIDLVSAASRAVVKKIASKIKNRYVKVPDSIIRKITLRTPIPVDNTRYYQLAKLDGTEIDVPLLNIGKADDSVTNIFVVVEPETGTIYDKKLYVLDNGVALPFDKSDVKKYINNNVRFMFTDNDAVPGPSGVGKGGGGVNSKHFIPIFQETRNLKYYDESEEVHNLFYSAFGRNHEYKTYNILATDPIPEIPEHFEQLSDDLSQSWVKAGETLRGAMLTFERDEYKERIREYVSTALGTSDSNVIDKAIERLRIHNEELIKFFDDVEDREFKNIYGFTYKDDAGENPLPADIARKIPIGISLNKSYRQKIFIYLDHPALNPVSSSTVFIHESTHQVGGTLDLCYINSVGKIPSPEFALEKFHLLLNDKDRILKSEAFVSFADRLIEHGALPKGSTPADALEMVRNDPMMRANLQLENADFVTLYLMDIDAIRRPPVAPEERLKRSTKDRTLIALFIRALIALPSDW